MENRATTDWFTDTRVFVYGTLKPGGFYWPKFCEGKVERFWKARAKGQIFHLPVNYPAVHFGGDDWVYGFVLELGDAQTLRGFDQLEGFDPGSPSDSRNDYFRKRIEVERIDSGDCIEVWSYEMGLEKIRSQGGARVESGDWLHRE